MGMSSLKIFLTIKAMRKKQFKPLFESVNNFTYTGVTKKIIGLRVVDFVRFLLMLFFCKIIYLIYENKFLTTQPKKNLLFYFDF